MYYTEFLRVRKALLVFAIVVAFVAAAVTSLTYYGLKTTKPYVSVSSGPGTKVITKRRHGGEEVVTIKSVKPGAVADITVTTTTVDNFGVKHVETKHVKRRGPVDADAHENWMTTVLGIAGFITAIFATVLASSLSRENSGHLEFAWTKPVSRVRYALGVFGVDALGIVTAYALTLTCAAVTAYAIESAMRSVHPFVSAPASPRELTLGLIQALLLPLAWYGIVQAASASLKSRGGLVSGLSWPAFMVLLPLADVPLPNTLHAVLTALNWFNPLAHFGSHTSPGSVQMGLPGPHELGGHFAALAVLALGGLVLATLQWRRLEI